MTDSPIFVFRWILLGFGVLALLDATILFEFTQRRFIAPLIAMSERMGGKAPVFMRNRAFRRAWNAMFAALLLGLWWFLGTPAGIALTQRLANNGS